MISAKDIGQEQTQFAPAQAPRESSKSQKVGVGREAEGADGPRTGSVCARRASSGRARVARGSLAVFGGGQFFFRDIHDIYHYQYLSRIS